MRQLRMIADDRIVSEDDYRNMHPKAMFAEVFAPLPDAEIVAEAPDLPTVAEYTAEIQAMLDNTAKVRGYDSILSACSYVTSSVPRFQAEGQACMAWRDAVWAEASDLLNAVTNGDMPQPTMPALLDMLPKITWPV